MGRDHLPGHRFAKLGGALEEYGANIRKYWLPIFFLLILAPLTITVPHVLLDSNNPSGAIEAPELETSSNGELLIILDGVGENVMLNYDMMPELNSKRAEAALLDLRTGPLTLSATCVSELMTGVPNSPIDGLRNFNLDHPGGPDPWTLAANDDQYSVGMVGSYVLGNMYGEHDNIEFIDTFQGHADYYEGDEDNSDKWGAYMGVERTIKHWVDRNNCTDVVVDTLPDIDPDDGSIVITHKYSSKENGNQVWFYKVINGQHEWPPGWPEKSGNGDLNTSEEIWKFFQEDIENRGL